MPPNRRIAQHPTPRHIVEALILSAPWGPGLRLNSDHCNAIAPGHLVLTPEKDLSPGGKSQSRWTILWTQVEPSVSRKA